MSEWKDGDEAMVTLYRVHGHLAEVECGDYLRTVHVECLHPLPTDPHQALKDAVIEAAKGYMKEGADVALYRELREAVGALEAAQTPPKPDPVEVFYQVTDGQSMCGPYGWKHCKDTRDVCYCRNNIASGLAAVEAARGAK